MDLKIPNIVKPIYLREYADKFEDTTIWVWVNPPRDARLELFERIALNEESDEQISALFSKLWSEGPEDTRLSPEEVLTMAKECMERDPQLWWWLVNQTRNLMLEHLGAKKKPLT
jgi:hypothetical protein